MSATILELFDRPVNRGIEEVVKVDQSNPVVVRQEIEEYVPTASIRTSYRRVLEHFREVPNKPTEGIGIWVSGFFGAGKSSFAKILGYVLENREVQGQHAAELFARQCADPEIEALLKAIGSTTPAKSVIFDVSTDAVVTDASEKLTDIVYRILLRELGYSTDRELAELEIELEGTGKLDAFRERVASFSQRSWDEMKELAATGRGVASRAMHLLDGATWPHADSWARSVRPVQVSANFVAERARELMSRRGEGRALVFVVDEVGQYVARSTQKLLDLQGLVQAIGRVGKNHAHQWKGQAWLVVTSQERLSEVVDNIEGKTVELAKVRDRFPIEVDLAPSDIREVTAQRVLKKKPAAKTALAALFDQHRGKLAEATRITGTLEKPALTADSFADLYPFLPYQVELIIDVVSGLRTQAGASRQVGGANRTIIKLAQQVLINEKTRLGEQPVGRLVTFDLVYDLQEGNVATERRRDIDEIEAAFGRDAMPTRVAKTLALLHFVRSLPRTAENLAALLHPSVDHAPVRDEVEKALEQLRVAGKVREGDQGWELLSAAGKSWEEKRRGIDVPAKERIALVQELSGHLFEGIGGYRYRNLRTFNVAPVVNGMRLGKGSGDVELHVAMAPKDDGWQAALDAARTRSNTSEGVNAVHWVVPLTDELEQALSELYKSREMVKRHERDKLSPDESRLLGEEKARAGTRETTTTNALRSALVEGTSFFRGVATPVKELGAKLDEAVRAAVGAAVPKLFDKFDLAAVKVGADDPRRIVESTTLAGLPAPYLDGTSGLGLVVKQGGDWTVKVDAPPLAEVLTFVTSRQQYGEKATGKMLEQRFTGYGYGWDLETVMLLTGTLFRAGKVELYNGRRYTSYAEEGAREPFRKTNVFRATTFTPRASALGFPALSQIARELETLYGDQVALEEGALATTIRKKAPAEATRAIAVLSVLDANGLPGAAEVASFRDVLQGLGEGTTEDTLLSFQSQRDTIAKGLTRLGALEKALAGSNLQMLREARVAVTQLWPQIETDADAALGADASALREALESPVFHEHLQSIGQRVGAIRKAHEAARSVAAEALAAAAASAIDDLRNRPEWEALPEEDQHRVLERLVAVRDRATSPGTSLGQLRAELPAVDGLRGEALAALLARYEAITNPPEPDKPEPVVHRVKAGKYVQHVLRNEEDVKALLEAIRAECLAAFARGDTVLVE